MRTAIVAVSMLLLVLGLCTLPKETSPTSTAVDVKPDHYEFLGEKYTTLQDLAAALDRRRDVEVGLSINEEQACVDAARVTEVVDLLKSRPNANLSFIGRSSTDACKR